MSKGRKPKRRDSEREDRDRSETLRRKLNKARPGKKSQSSARKKSSTRRTPASGAPPSAKAGATEDTAELQSELDHLRRRFSSAQSSAALSDISHDIGNLDSQLADLPVTLDGLRGRGFVHAGRLEDRIAALQRQWRGTRPRAEAALRQQVNRLRREVQTAKRRLDRASARDAASVEAADNAVDGLQSQISSARSSVTGLYTGIEQDLRQVTKRMEQADWMLEQLAQSGEIRMQETEGPLLAGEVEWERDGEEGPDGILYLTDQRLLFEQKEEVATKKLFGLVTTESETVQRLLLDVPVHEIETISHSEEGGFLGVGKDDYLELVFGASAPVSRARFEIKDQESEEWAMWLKRVQTGQIDRERAEEYADEVDAAEATAAAFPTQCPSCFAAVAPPPRGVTSLTCEYCGSVIRPESGP